MREFDHNGLLLAGLQGKIFARSIELTNCSSLVFLRRFKNSSFVDSIDKNESALLDFNVDGIINKINKEFKNDDYGTIKFKGEILFWMGYIYRYICYTRNVTTSFVFKLIPPTQLKNLYYVYHTQSEEWVINRILEISGKNEDYFDINYRVKERLKEKLKETSR